MNNKELKKIVLASILASASIVIEMVTNIPGFIPRNVSFGFPYYAIPLIIGALVLGPWYGIAIAMVADTVGYLVTWMPQGFAWGVFQFVTAISWAIIPWFLAKNSNGWQRLGLGVLIGHVLASTFSTLSDFVYWFGIEQDFMLALTHLTTSLSLRLVMMPGNIVIITAITYQIHLRIAPLYLEFKPVRVSEIEQ